MRRVGDLLVVFVSESLIWGVSSEELWMVGGNVSFILYFVKPQWQEPL